MSQRHCELCDEMVEEPFWVNHTKTNRHLNREFIQERIDQGELTFID